MLLPKASVRNLQKAYGNIARSGPHCSEIRKGVSAFVQFINAPGYSILFIFPAISRLHITIQGELSSIGFLWGITLSYQVRRQTGVTGRISTFSRASSYFQFVLPCLFNPKQDFRRHFTYT